MQSSDNPQVTLQSNEDGQRQPVNETDIPDELIPTISVRDAMVSGSANRLAALFTDDGIVQPLSREQIDEWLSLNKSNAASLLAAAQLSGDLTLLHRALTNFPTDPRVLLTAAHRLPESKRELLDRLKTAAPDNVLADYLSARDHLRNGRPDKAIEDLAFSSQKNRFEDYIIDRIQTREEAFLQAGRSPAEAKATAGVGAAMPHLAELKGLAQDMATLQKQYLANGDTVSAEWLAEVGLQMAQHLSSGDGSGTLINQLVGYAVERLVLSPLDSQTQYDFMEGTISGRFEQLQTQRARAKQSVQIFNQWWPNASESEIITYFDRLKVSGESSALAWLENRWSPQ